MEAVAAAELRLRAADVREARPGLLAVRVQRAWLRHLVRHERLLSPDRTRPPDTDILISVYQKKNEKAFPLLKSKLGSGKPDIPMTYSQLLLYVSQMNHRNLWKESYKKRFAQYNVDPHRESSTINILDYNSVLVEVILRFYGCKILKLKIDPTDPDVQNSEIIFGKHASKTYETHSNILPAICAIELENNIYVIHHHYHKNNLLDCVTFSPALLENNYTRRLFLIYQILQAMKSMYNRGLNFGEITLDDIYITEDLWIQIVPPIASNVIVINAEHIAEQSKLNPSPNDSISNFTKKSFRTIEQSEGKIDLNRDDLINLEALCDLWIRGCLSNLDYLVHLNILAGRRAGDPTAHHVVPWITDFTSRCGKQWRDLTKSKYRLTKGDRQLDMTFDILGKDCQETVPNSHQIPHHVSDVLSDITYYVYMARRTPKNILCQNVRQNWVPAEYPSSIQRIQEWTPDECIPEFFTDPTVFRSIHEDLKDLEIPPWATCVEDFVIKHREALESAQVSESLHHWIDLTFGYKLSGSAAIKAKNVCLSLVDGHTDLNRSGPVQLFTSPHPARLSHSAHSWGEKIPPRIVWHREKKKSIKVNESSDDISDVEDDISNIPQNLSNLNLPSTSKQTEPRILKHKSSSRSRIKHSKKSFSRDVPLSSSIQLNDSKPSSPQSGQHLFKVHRSELGKGNIYLPKEYNPTSFLSAVENLHSFKTKTFYSNNKYDKNIEIAISKNKNSLNNLDGSFKSINLFSTFNPENQSERNSFTNQMFVASYEQQNYYKKYNKLDPKDMHIKEKKDRSFNTRFVTNTALFKEGVLSNRRKDMQVLGCLIVELFLYHKLRPLTITSPQSFNGRYKMCRLVLKNNMHILPRCVKHMACLLLQLEDPRNANNEAYFKENENMKDVLEKSPVDVIYPCVNNFGLPPPTSLQFLQPLLSNFLFPFPNSFSNLYLMASVLHEYSITERELNILYSFECDGQECSKYQSFDKTKLYFIQKIAESKVHSCSLHLEGFLSQINTYNQFDSVDLFIAYFTNLLRNKDTCILAAWYLFDPIAKALGPIETSKKLLHLILSLYDEQVFEKDSVNNGYKTESSHTTIYNSKKSVKLYHNIFLLQLIVRFGLQCFLENFIPHLVEAVGGYKDVACNDTAMHSHLSNIEEKNHNSMKKLIYCDESLKTLIAPHDAVSPDTSCGSENVLTPCVEKDSSTLIDRSRKNQIDAAIESELFHFETESKENISPKMINEIDGTKNWDAAAFNKAKIKCLLEEIDLECSSNNFDIYLNHTQAIEATESVCGCDEEDNKKIEDLDTEIVNIKISPDEKQDNENIDIKYNKLESVSPSINITSACKTFTSYVQVKRDEINYGNNASRSFDISSPNTPITKSPKSYNHQKSYETSKSHADISNNMKDYKISEMTSESLIWLAHRLGPVLTCKYVTRNLLKMLTLCYIGQENLCPLKDKSKRGLDSLCIANGRLIGDRNAKKVIECLTSIAELYGEQLILLQYFPHMGDLIASCRRRISAPLEGGLIACLQLLRYLIPFMSDVKLMEQLQDIILKNILHPTVRLISSTRSTFPSGHIARSALARKFLETIYVIAIRIGPEMTRKHLCVPALQRFCLSFDKAYGFHEYKKQDIDMNSEYKDNIDQHNESHNSSTDDGIPFLEICRDGTTAEWRVKGGVISRIEGEGLGDSSSSPTPLIDSSSDMMPCPVLEEIKAVFTCELAYQTYIPFVKIVGEETMERSLKNHDMLKDLCQNYDKYKESNAQCDTEYIQSEPAPSTSTQPDFIFEDVFSQQTANEFHSNRLGVDSKLGKSITVPIKKFTNDETSNANSFGSNIAIVGNRIDVQNDPNDDNLNTNEYTKNDALNKVSCKMGTGIRTSRHLRGDWFMYWEHEIGRPDKENKFNLKQIKLQTFAGHTHSVRNIVCLDNENSFMTASRDKTVKLWSLRNQGDGSAVSSCQWTYTGHRKGVLSLTFLESLRLTVSTDATVHIWDPYVESTIAQLDYQKTAPVSIVKAMMAPSAVILAATTDTALKLIDAKTCSYTHELKVTFNPSTVIRCICVSPSGRWIAVGLATGYMSLLDPRTGTLISHWKAHDEVLQLVTINESTIVSSGLDQAVLVWSTVDGKLKFHLKGSTEPVNCLASYYNELISGTTNNRIGVHTAIDQNANFSSTKLRSDTFKGVLTSMTVLPLNRMLLLGGEGGNVSLLC